MEKTIEKVSWYIWCHRSYIIVIYFMKEINTGFVYRWIKIQHLQNKGMEKDQWKSLNIVLQIVL